MSNGERERRFQNLVGRAFDMFAQEFLPKQGTSQWVRDEWEKLAAEFRELHDAPPRRGGSRRCGVVVESRGERA